ncbi:MAG: hypothetical protein CMH27_02880 [Micavibrio sp.]|nr:hypothetical protein [Micavibrio sp.]|tara:strand:+ start:5019 stop:5930 length:912 start_codon:yes stop_codon:yes gene_type:complete
MPDINLSHSLTYNIQGNASISDVASSLLANEQMIKYAFDILEECIDGFCVTDINIKLKKVTHESPLREILAYSLVVAFQKDLEEEVPPIIEGLLNIEITDDYNSLVTVITMLVAIYGVSTVCKKIFPDKKQVNLDDDYERLVYIAGDQINISPDKIEKAIEKKFSAGHLRPLQKASLDFFKPSKREGARIVGADGNYISEGAVMECPSEVDLSGEDDLDMYPLQNVEIEIRATDKDSKKQGWAAIVNDVTKKRLKMHIYPTISVGEIIGEDRIRGNIIVVNKKDANGDYLPKMYHLVELLNEI